MEESTLPALIRRIERLEQANRRLKQAVLLIIAISASILLMGQASWSRLIEAEEFRLRGSDGRYAGSFKVGEDGLPYLVMGDPFSGNELNLQVASVESGGGAFLSLGRGKGFDAGPRLVIRAYADGRPGFIAAYDESNQREWSVP